MNKPEILIIDDEQQLRKMLGFTLRTNHYSVTEAGNAREGMVIASNHPPDLILLDLNLPDQPGMEVLDDLRQWYTGPVIVVSVENDEEIIIKALDKGANDYAVKPFRTGELLARIRSALRTSASEEQEQVVGNDHLQVDLLTRSVRKDNEVVKLTATEFNLLALLARNEGKVMTHAFLLRAVWGPGFINQLQYLRVFVAQIRRKIEDDPNRPVYLLTESGIGYRFVVG